MAEKKFTHRATCPVDNEQKAIELIYTKKENDAVYWRNNALNRWCEQEENCPKKRGEPARCPLLLSAPRFLPG